MKIKLSESTFLQKFKQLVKFVLCNTDLIIKEGETVPNRTQRMQVINGNDNDIGGKIDMLLAVDQEKDDDDIQLCPVECKETSADESIIIRQQSENVRINCCTMNDVLPLLKTNKIYLTCMDFAVVVIVVLNHSSLKFIMFLNKISKNNVPKSPYDLDNMQSTYIVTAYFYGLEEQKVMAIWSLLSSSEKRPLLIFSAMVILPVHTHPLGRLSCCPAIKQKEQGCFQERGFGLNC